MSAVKNLWNWIGGKFEHNLFGPIGSFFGNISDIAKFARGEGTGNDSLDSWVHTMTGDAPNGLQLWQAGREDSAYQRAASDMSAAGLNPALMYGSGGPSVSSAGSQSPTGISDLLQLAMLPLQMENLRAETKRILADAGNIEQRTRTEEQETALKALMVQWYPTLKETEVDKLIADIDEAYSNVNFRNVSADKVVSEKEAQDIINEYLPVKLDLQIKEIQANTNRASADAKLSLMRESFEKIQRDFAVSNKFLMSSSDSLMIVTYIASLLGLNTESITKFITEDVPKIVNETIENSHLGTPGGPHK